MADRQQGLADLTWLEKLRLPDMLSEQAYEESSQDVRARLKAGMAYAQSVFGQVEASVERHLTCAGHSPLTREELLRPVDWTCLLIACDYQAAARVLACAVLPRLCAVQDVFAIFSGPLPQASALVSLELAGVQDLFCLDTAQTEACLTQLGGCGRILNLGQKLTPALAANPCLCLNETVPPPLYGLDLELFAPDLLRVMHGVVPESRPSPPSQQSHCGLFVSEDRARQMLASGEVEDSLLITPGCEGCWRYPCLTRNSFIKRCERISQLAS